MLIYTLKKNMLLYIVKADCGWWEALFIALCLSTPHWRSDVSSRRSYANVRPSWVDGSQREFLGRMAADCPD